MISLTAMNPPVADRRRCLRCPMLSTNVPSLTVCARARVSVVSGDVGEQDDLPIAFLDHDELAVADVGEAFRIVEVRALRTAAGRQRHRVDQLPGLRDLDDRRAAVADDEQRVGVPVVGHRRDFLREQAVGRRSGPRRFGQVEAADADVEWTDRRRTAATLDASPGEPISAPLAERNAPLTPATLNVVTSRQRERGAAEAGRVVERGQRRPVATRRS